MTETASKPVLAGPSDGARGGGATPTMCVAHRVRNEVASLGPRYGEYDFHEAQGGARGRRRIGDAEWYEFPGATTIRGAGKDSGAIRCKQLRVVSTVKRDGPSASSPRLQVQDRRRAADRPSTVNGSSSSASTMLRETRRRRRGSLRRAIPRVPAPDAF